MNNKKWYVLQVLTGSERDVQKELQRRGIAAIVPIENRVIRTKGKWKTKEYIIFPGYIFINMQYTWSQYYIMSGIRQIVRILGGGECPEPLSDDEAELIVANSELFREPSVVRCSNGDFEVISGVLRELQDKIKRVDLRSRRATVHMNIAGTMTEFKLSFDVEKKAEE